MDKLTSLRKQVSQYSLGLILTEYVDAPASLASPSQTWCQIHPFTIHREQLHRLEGHDTCCSIQNYKDLPFTLHNLQPYNICPRRPFNWSPQPGGQTTAAVVKTQRSGKVKILHSLKGLVGGECCGNKDRMAETVPSNRGAKLIDVRIRSPYHWWIGLLKCWISCEFLAMQSHSHWAIWFTAQFQV